jgi:hypothetical protein
MKTRTRHLLGLILGIIATPVLFAALTGGVVLAGRGGIGFDVKASFGALGIAALLVAILAAPRVSPIASLIAGLAFAGLASLVVVPGADPVGRMRALLPSTDISMGHGPALPFNSVSGAVLATGAYALVGALLVLASLAPSRWRARPVTLPEPLPEPEPWMPNPPTSSETGFFDTSSETPVATTRQSPISSTPDGL